MSNWPEWTTDDGRIRLINADCLEVLPTLEAESAECAVFSPPYNLAKNASGGGSSKKSYDDWYPDEMPERLYRAHQAIVIEELLRICRSSVFYNHRVRYAWHQRNEYRVPSNVYHPMDWLSQFPIWCEIVWDRASTTGHGNGRFRLCDERIYQIRKPLKWHDNGLSTVWRIPPEKNSEHVCAFPEEIPRRCVMSVTDTDDVVVDPYSGSGTTAAVCAKNGRRCIAIEKEEKYFRIGIERVKKEPRRTARDEQKMRQRDLVVTEV